MGKPGTIRTALLSFYGPSYVGVIPMSGWLQAPTQPLDGATGFYRTGSLSFYISTRLVGRPMSGWHQTSVNKPATTQFGRYVQHQEQ